MGDHTLLSKNIPQTNINCFVNIKKKAIFPGVGRAHPYKWMIMSDM